MSVVTIKSVHFKNLKVLRNATLPLSRFTLIVGPNGSGKSTAMQALQMARNPEKFELERIITSGLEKSDAEVAITIAWNVDSSEIIGKTRRFRSQISPSGGSSREYSRASDRRVPSDIANNLDYRLQSFRIYSFDAQALSAPVNLAPNIELAPNGNNLAGVLDNLRDNEPERFEALNQEMARWLPEFDRILFGTPSTGKREFLLRSREGHHKIPATDLSHGTLYALAFLTLAYLSNPPSIICFEEPDRGIHPRLLREIRDAMYRLCYPEDYGDKRSPVQVLATTHSPYLLDLYRNHPEEIVIAHKDEQGAHFERLSDKPNIKEFLNDAPLGEVWFSGILGGVPNQP